MQQVRKHLVSLTAVFTLAVMAGCSSQKNPYEFLSAKDAVKCCHSKLSELTEIKDASLGDLIKIIKDYTELKDSCYSVFIRDTTFDYRGELAVEYVGVSDSIQNTIIDIAKAKTRTMEDIVELRVETANNREKIQSTKDFKEVRDFFTALDTLPTLPDVRTTITTYLKLLEKNIGTDEKSITAFLAKEDQCFRSLLKYFPEVPENVVQAITENTVEVFDNLEDSLLTQGKTSSLEDRTMIYMTMRLNRRIVQNADGCAQQIRCKQQLSKYTSSNYRWMLMQPFIAIDQTGMAVVTDGQVAAMKEIARQLPLLLAQLDGQDIQKLSREESEKLSNILSEFFLNAYLKMIL